MAEALILELRGLGIPFFSIKQSSILDRSPEGGQLSQSGNQPTVSRSDLSAFQRRMLELLQDLCKEWPALVFHDPQYYRLCRPDPWRCMIQWPWKVAIIRNDFNWSTNGAGHVKSPGIDMQPNAISSMGIWSMFISVRNLAKFPRMGQGQVQSISFMINQIVLDIIVIIEHVVVVLYYVHECSLISP